MRGVRRDRARGRRERSAAVKEGIGDDGVGFAMLSWTRLDVELGDGTLISRWRGGFASRSSNSTGVVGFFC